MSPAVIRSTEAVSVLQCTSLLSAGEPEFWLKLWKSLLPSSACQPARQSSRKHCHTGDTANRGIGPRKRAICMPQSRLNLHNSSVPHENLLYDGAEERDFISWLLLSCSNQSKSAAVWWKQMLPDAGLLLTTSKKAGGEQDK